MTDAPIVALDAVGGDHGPSVVVDGAVQAVRELNARVALVGPSDEIRAALRGSMLSRITASRLSRHRRRLR